MTRDHRVANTNCDSQVNDAQNSSRERLPELQHLLWTPKITQNSIKWNSHLRLCWDMSPHDSVSVFFSGGAQLWQQSLTGSSQYPFYARAICTASSFLPPPKSLFFLSCSSRQICTFPRIKYWEKNTWIDTLTRSGCRLPNQQVSASESLISRHLSSLLIRWTLSREHRTGEHTAMGGWGWGLWLRGNIPYGCLRLFSDRLKKSVPLYQPNPTQPWEQVFGRSLSCHGVELSMFIQWS